MCLALSFLLKKNNDEKTSGPAPRPRPVNQGRSTQTPPFDPAYTNGQRGPNASYGPSSSQGPNGSSY
ncbi:hypothetical protein VI817_005007 [Penicillium citrinum]|nr:hypothetical protein VI817_005007 [Penicillium citrinum]